MSNSDDTKNCFVLEGEQRARRAQAGQRSVEEREAARQEQRERWVTHEHAQPRAAASPDARPTRPEVELPTPATLFAIVEGTLFTRPIGSWLLASELTLNSLCNRVVEQLATTGAALSVELVEDEADWLVRRHYLELPPDCRFDAASNAILRYAYGVPNRPAPQLYPPYQSPAVKQREQLAAIATASAAWLAEYKQKNRLPFEELKRQARAGFKPPKSGGPGDGQRW